MDSISCMWSYKKKIESFCSYFLLIWFLNPWVCQEVEFKQVLETYEHCCPSLCQLL